MKTKRVGILIVLSLLFLLAAGKRPTGVIILQDGAHRTVVCANGQTVGYQPRADGSLLIGCEGALP